MPGIESSGPDDDPAPPCPGARVRLTFHGAAGEVTGSMHLLETGGENVLLDCGLFQGPRAESRLKNQKFPLKPSDFSAVILSHAHIDHAGRLPILARLGYEGPVYCTPATRDLSVIMLADAGHIQEADAAFLQKRGQKDARPLYTMGDAAKIVECMVDVPYNTPTEVRPGVTLTFHDAGHILGSASVALDLAGGKRIVFSGDIGRAGLPLIGDPVSPKGPRADALIIESTYAGRIHESVEEAQTILAGHVVRIARRGGKIMIPAFAVGRTQEIMYELHGLLLAGKIPNIPIYVDSPLAVNATDVFRRHGNIYDRGEQLVGSVKDPLDFSMAHYVRSLDESKRLNTMHGPAIIIAASGMAESGRIVHHLRHGLGDPKNMVLLVGWQGSGTLGERLRSGQKEVRIFGDPVDVRAEIQMIAGYSAHGDREDLGAWVKGLGELPARAFCVHGEAGLQPMAKLLDEAGIGRVDVPSLGQSFDL